MAIYLDHAAATPVDQSVFAAMMPFFSTQFHNPSAMYGPALDVSRALEEARSSSAQNIGAKPSEIIFTAGSTEANNLAIHGIMRKYPDATIAYSAIEHDSVRMPAQTHTSIELAVQSDGLVEVSSMADRITDNMVLVSIMYANNEVGTVQPIRRLASELEAIRKDRRQRGVALPLYFHVDAAQAGNYLDLHVHRLGVDLLTINGGKLYGPKQSGILFVKSSVFLEPLIQGGGQERSLRSGTENVANAIGFATALQLSIEMRHEESTRLHDLREQFIAKLLQTFPGATINGSRKYRLPNNVHVTIPGIDNERVLMALDMEGIYAAAGSACSASHEEPSHVLAAMGFDADHIQSSLRFSMGRTTQPSDIDDTIAALQRILA